MTLLLKIENGRKSQKLQESRDRYVHFGNADIQPSQNGDISSAIAAFWEIFAIGAWRVWRI